MDINWSLFDGAIGLLLIGIVIWVALKLAKRIIIGIIAIVVIGVLFFGWHIGGFSRASMEDEPQAESAASP
jgi:hypothetical protein